jgi:hypothetical protein
VVAESAHGLGFSGDALAGGVVEAVGFDEAEGYVSV